MSFGFAAVARKSFVHLEAGEAVGPRDRSRAQWDFVDDLLPLPTGWPYWTPGPCPGAEWSGPCARAHRDPASVRILAVTKIFGAEVIREAWAAGLREFGENYVQEMERKEPQVADLEGA